MSMVLASPHVLAQHDLAEHEPTREWASQIPPRVSTEHVRVLLVGERGGGKTTLWRNLLASYAGAQVCPPRPQHLPPTQPCVNLPDASQLSTAGLRSQRPACNFNRFCSSILPQGTRSSKLKQAFVGITPAGVSTRSRSRELPAGLPAAAGGSGN